MKTKKLFCGDFNIDILKIDEFTNYISTIPILTHPLRNFANALHY